MKMVRLEGLLVAEILPESTYEKGISFWYGEEFAENCHEVSDEVMVNMRYDVATGQIIPDEPLVIEPTLAERIAQLEQDNLTTLEAIAEVYELTLGGV